MFRVQFVAPFCDVVEMKSELRILRCTLYFRKREGERGVFIHLQLMGCVWSMLDDRRAQNLSDMGRIFGA